MIFLSSQNLKQLLPSSLKNYETDVSIYLEWCINRSYTSALKKSSLMTNPQFNFYLLDQFQSRAVKARRKCVDEINCDFKVKVHFRWGILIPSMGLLWQPIRQEAADMNGRRKWIFVVLRKCLVSAISFLQMVVVESMLLRNETMRIHGESSPYSERTNVANRTSTNGFYGALR